MGISIGIVGVGSFGSEFIGLFQKHLLVRRVALCDVRTERLAERARQCGITECYSSLEELCRSDLEAVALFTQPWLHAPQIVQCLEAGKHVYSAVPVASADDGDEVLEWCDRVVETCRRTGLSYMMGETSHFRPQAMYCRRRAATGDFGRFVHAEGEYLHDVDWPSCNLRDVSRQRWGDAWDESKSGDIPMHYPTHSLGGFLSVMPAHATHVSALGFHDPDDDWHRADTESGNVFGNETALLRLSNGATATLKEYRRIGAGHEGFRLMGTHGVFDDSLGLCRWTSHEEPPGAPLTEDEMRDPLPPDVAAAFTNARGVLELGGHSGSHAYLVHEFVESVAHSRLPAINAWQAVRYLAPGIMAHKSALRGGELLPVPDWGEPPTARGQSSG